MSRLRFALFTHDAYGLGHVRRSSRILGALAQREPDASLLFISGSPATRLLGELPPNADVLKIPTVITSGGEGERPSTLNIGVAELCSMRGGITQRALELFQPDVLLVDNFPLGTRLELLPALREMKHRRTRTVLGLRDVVDPPQKVRRDWERDGMYDLIERLYDRIIVYGEKSILDAADAYGFSPALAERTVYSGYVTEQQLPAGGAEAVCRTLGVKEGFLLATVGGGGDGRPLLEAFLEALDHLPGAEAVVVTGEFMSAADRLAVAAAAAPRPRVVLRDYLPDMPSVMAAAGLVVAMGGYNTSAEIIAARTRAVLVPRTWRSGEHATRGRTGVDGEQMVRAEALARLGLVTVVDPRELSGESLAAAIGAALDEASPVAAPELNLGGAHSVAAELVSLARQI